MFRSAARTTLRRQILSSPALLPRAPARTVATTAAKSKSTYKSTILRWGLAGAAIYYYNTSNVFAEEPKFYNEPAVPIPPEEDERPPSLLPEKSYSAKRSTKLTETHAEDDRLRTASEAGTTTKGPSKEEGARSAIAVDEGVATGEEGGLGGLEEEAGQQGAFDPETGKINWDCPCLGGMAYGPCGSEFREAFSCFVYSTEDPKGVDCIEKFKGMQTCFQKHPEIYGAEIDDDEEAAIDAKLDAMEAENAQDGESPTPSPKASIDAREETGPTQPSTEASAEAKPTSS